MLRRYGGFVTVIILYHILPVSSDGVKCKDNGYFAKRVATFVYLWDIVRASPSNDVKQAKLDSNLRGFILFLDEQYLCKPFDLCWFHVISDNRLIYPGLIKFSGF